MFPTSVVALSCEIVLTWQTSAVWYHYSGILLPMCLLRTVFHTGLLPPDRACRDWWAPHAEDYLCPYGFLYFKQYILICSSNRFHDAGELFDGAELL